MPLYPPFVRRTYNLRIFRFHIKMKIILALFSIFQCSFVVSQLPNEGWWLFTLLVGLVYDIVEQPADYKAYDAMAYDDLDSIGQSGFEAIIK